jgi:predicted patatin/cPLA2 family phospholipase
MDEPKHQTIKVWYRTYKELKKLAAEKPESLAALLDRLVQAERERRMKEVAPPA